MSALTAQDERAWVAVHAVRSRIVDRILPALGQPIIGDAKPATEVTPDQVVAARADLVGAAALLFDALDALDAMGEAR